MADVLFGDYNPAGRLPITFYKSVDQLPDFQDYSMKGRTYRYMTQTSALSVRLWLELYDFRRELYEAGSELFHERGQDHGNG